MYDEAGISERAAGAGEASAFASLSAEPQRVVCVCVLYVHVYMGIDVCACSCPRGGQRSHRTSCSIALCFISWRQGAWGETGSQPAPSILLTEPSTVHAQPDLAFMCTGLRSSSGLHHFLSSVASFQSSPILDRLSYLGWVFQRGSCGDGCLHSYPVTFQARNISKLDWRLAESLLQKCQPVPQ